MIYLIASRVLPIKMPAVFLTNIIFNVIMKVIQSRYFSLKVCNKIKGINLNEKRYIKLLYALCLLLVADSFLLVFWVIPGSVLCSGITPGGTSGNYKGRQEFNLD